MTGVGVRSLAGLLEGFFYSLFNANEVHYLAGVVKALSFNLCFEALADSDRIIGDSKDLFESLLRTFSARHDGREGSRATLINHAIYTTSILLNLECFSPYSMMATYILDLINFCVVHAPKNNWGFLQAMIP